MTAEEIKTILLNEGLHEESVERMIESYKQMRLYYGMRRYPEVGNHVGNFCENCGNLILDVLGENIRPSASLHTILQDIESNNDDPAVDKMLRITIPRFLRAAYDMRSNRDTVHANLEIPVNHADQRNAVTACTWILSELVRIFGDSSMDEARNLIEHLASDISPYVDEYQGRRLIMTDELSGPEEILIHLYNAPIDVEVNDLKNWVPGLDLNAVRQNLRDMERRREVIYEGDHAKITPIGARKAEDIIEEAEIDV